LYEDVPEANGNPPKAKGKRKTVKKSPRKANKQEVKGT